MIALVYQYYYVLKKILFIIKIAYLMLHLIII
jgi:hypothetical protein